VVAREQALDKCRANHSAQSLVELTLCDRALLATRLTRRPECFWSLSNVQCPVHSVQCQVVTGNWQLARLAGMSEAQCIIAGWQWLVVGAQTGRRFFSSAASYIFLSLQTGASLFVCCSKLAVQANLTTRNSRQPLRQTGAQPAGRQSSVKTS